MRCRKALLRKILAEAAKASDWEAGFFAVTAYTFGLRAPSELIRQAKASLFKDLGTKIVYGPIKRKGKQELQTLSRWCTCSADILTCPHHWLRAQIRARPDGQLFTVSASVLMTRIQGILQRLGVESASEYTSHCFRRGAGVDVLESQGLPSMLAFGQWSSPAAARPYASADEQTAQAMGQALADYSDEDA